MTLLIDNQPVTLTRGVERVIAGQCSCNGAGVQLKRMLTQNLQHRLDPFLMFDAFRRDATDDCTKGFPEHPHRGFEAVTYMIAGRMGYRDHEGHQGVLENGGVQWLTAGRGVIHSEIPQQQDGAMEGFQLWLNLPGCDKMTTACTRDFAADELKHFTVPGGAEVTVIAGESHGVNGAITREATVPLFLDIHLPAGSRFAQPLPAGHNAFVYVYRGEVTIGEQTVPLQRMALLANDPAADGLVIEALGEARVLLLAGRPIKEQIAQYGPFVMNTQKEIYQTLSDFHGGRLCASAKTTPTS
jgi:redox-sensitive bicupin YhaK (pirin superfamily)